MLLFDDTKRLEKALGPDATEAIVHILEKQAEQQTLRQKEELATKADLKELELATNASMKELELATNASMKELELATKASLKELELKLTQRMFAAAGIIIAVLGFLIKF